jgi:negative regulator of sigma-B (phosphoserine phosphatase)
MDAVPISQGELIEWAVAARALPGQEVSGDAHLVQPFAGGVLVAVVDGLGHGEDAATASGIATDILSRHAHEQLVSLVRRCHEGLYGTRGVAMSLASIGQHSRSLRWVAVGNVEASLFRSRPGSAPVRDSLMLRGGVVGYRLPPVHATSVTVRAGDLLVMSTDGISGFSLDGIRLAEPPATIADRILAQHSRDSDDALVLVARCRDEVATQP